MIARLLMAGLFMAALVSAQGRGDDSGGMGMGGGTGSRRGGRDMGADMGSMRVQRQSREEQIADKLKLNKEQKEQLGAILSAAREKAGPVRENLVKQRRAFAEAMLAGKTEDDLKPVIADYAAAAAQLTGVEAEAFAKIYAMLRPNQQSRARQGFELMAGMFDSAGRGQGPGRGKEQGR